MVFIAAHGELTLPQVPVRGVATLPLVLAAFAASATPAAAAPLTVAAGGSITAGPELDGERVVWGEEQRGDLVVREHAAGTLGELVRLAALRERRRSRGFGGLGSVLATSADWLAFVENTTTILSAEGDSVTLTVRSRLRLGPTGGGTPPRLPMPRGTEATAVAVDGPVLAYADERIGPNGRPEGAQVVVRAPEGTRSFLVSRGFSFVRRLHVAGPYVSWLVERTGPGGSTSRVVVADRLTGRVVLRVRPSRRRARGIDDHDLRADGTVALLVGSATKRFRTDLAVASPAQPLPRVLRRNVSSTRVEITGDHVAVPLLDDVSRERALALVPLNGTARPRIVARFPQGRSLLLQRFAFNGRRIAWAEADVGYVGEATDQTPARVQVRDVGI